MPKDLAPTDCAAIRPGVNARREIAIWPLIVWAFQRECAQLDFDPVATVRGGRAASADRVMARYGALGCRITGGGRSDPHPDADKVAEQLAALPALFGGDRMARDIADLAAAGRVPVHSPARHVEPLNLRQNQHGRRAKPVPVREVYACGADAPMMWPAIQRRNRKGAIVTQEPECCAVRIWPSQAVIDSHRATYTRWRDALGYMQAVFRVSQDLTGFVVTKDLPPDRPWRES